MGKRGGKKKGKVRRKKSGGENVASVREQLPTASLQSNSPSGDVPLKLVFFS